MKEQKYIKCLQQSCPKRLTCAIAQGQIEGNRIIYTGYIEGKCNEYKQIKENKK